MRARLWFLLLMTPVWACAEPQPTVNRVQPGALSKDIFRDSDWYAASTVIDSPYSAAAFVGAGTAATKVTWEIQERHLIARASRAHVDEVEAPAVAGPGAGRPSVAAIYAIESHFDIRRAYNAVTGEEQNVIVENESDRPWYEREYMRVDFSQNLAAGDLSMALTGGLGSVSMEPIAYAVEDPSDPFAPKLEKNEQGRVDYIDVVNKFLLSPTTTYVEQLGQTLPACLLATNAHLDCNPGEVAVRNAFLRVDETRDYEPMEYTADRMNRAGYFLTTHDAYDRDYGPLASARLRLVNRHNLWQQSHARDKQGEFETCAADGDCGGGGSLCDTLRVRAMAPEDRPKKVAGYCTLPYRERDVRPIAYHLSRDFPEDLLPVAQNLADGWNAAFSDTIASLREIECQEAGGGDCAKERERRDGKSAFVLCHNPVVEDDHAACGEPGTAAELGDLRYNTLVWVSDPHISSPLGYGPSSTDTDTGEIISGNAYLYGAAVETYAAMGRDMVALMNGDLDETQITNNGAFSQWVEGFRTEQARARVASEREAHRHAVPLDGADVEKIAAALSLGWLKARLGTDKAQPSVPRPGEWLARIAAAQNAVLEVGDAARLDPGLARLDRLKGTEIERKLLSPETLLAAGVDPRAAVSEDVLERASPLRGQSLTALRAVEDLRNQLGRHQNTCLLQGDYVDQGMLGLAREIAREATEGDGKLTWYGKDYTIAKDGKVDYEAVKRMFRAPIFHFTMQHEVGHTIGLRHNFGASYDAINFHPRYWELRSADGTMRGRAWDPKTQAEIDGRIDEYAYASVMDYGGNYAASQAMGVGKYDVFAIKLGYGDLVEVFTDVPQPNVARLGAAGALSGGIGGLGAIDIGGGGLSLRLIPYTEMPALVGGIANLEKRTTVRYRSLQADPQVVAALGGGTADLLGVELKTIDAQGRPVVSYRYCGDEFADLRPSCQRYDSGADEYETMTSVIDQYWNSYVFNNFMRQRIGFDPTAHASRIYSRYFQKLQSTNLYYSFFSGIGDLLGGTSDFLTSETGLGPYTLAVGAGYGLLTRVVAAPEPGGYTAATTLDGQDIYDQGTDFISSLLGTSTGGVQIDGFEGRSLYSDYEIGPDQSFVFLTSVGYFQDKNMALQTLIDPGRQIVIGNDLISGDLRRMNVTYYTTFRDSMNEVLRGVIGEDWGRYAARYMPSGELRYPNAAQQAGIDVMEGVPLDPNVGFTLQVYAMVYSMALTPRTFDQSYISRARLFVRGASESVDLELPDGQALVQFVDDDSGLVYQALSYPDAEGRETGVAARALLRALELQAAGDAETLASWIDNLNTLRMLTHLFGSGGDAVTLAPPNSPSGEL